MIQRIQSLFLLLAVATYVCLFFFPISEFFNPEKCDLVLSVLKVEDRVPINIPPDVGTLPLIIINGLQIALTFIAIFLFKNRGLQVKFNNVALLMNIVFIAAIFYYSDKLGKISGSSASYLAGVYIAIIPLLFLVMANRFIRKDERMVRSVERLR